MRVEVRQFKERSNLVIIPETEADKAVLDEMGPLGTDLKAQLRLSDGLGEYYLLMEGQLRTAPQGAAANQYLCGRCDAMVDKPTGQFTGFPHREMDCIKNLRAQRDAVRRKVEEREAEVLRLSNDYNELDGRLLATQERIKALEAIPSPAPDAVVAEALTKALQDDATDLWRVTNAIRDEVRSRFWITEGRGPYAYDDDEYRKEARIAFDNIMALIKQVQRPASDRFHDVIKRVREEAAHAARAPAGEGEG